jgi:predicted RNA binding protein YcfA (HicA-like mRNA interferase family)
MRKLPVLSGREIVKILEKQGFEIVGRKGSHVRLKKKSSGDVRIVLVPLHNEVKKGTLKSILRQAGLTQEELK